MGIDSFYGRYRAARERRVLRTMTNPLWIAWMVALTWIFFRWWPAVLFTVWLAVCTAAAVRRRRSGS
jgi:hypothetical protein